VPGFPVINQLIISILRCQYRRPCHFFRRSAQEHAGSFTTYFLARRSGAPTVASCCFGKGNIPAKTSRPIVGGEDGMRDRQRSVLINEMGMEMHRRMEWMFAGLMKCIMQIGQTHSVYIIEPADYDAFAPRNSDVTERLPREAVVSHDARSLTR
jgi:hypothetical protein